MRFRALFAVAAVVAALCWGLREPALARPRAQLAPRDQMDPDLVFLRDLGRYLMVWSEDRGAGHRIYARYLHGNGLPVNGPDSGEWLATRSSSGTPPGDQRWPAVINGLLVYSERAPGGADFDLYAQRLFENGRPSGLPMSIQAGPGDQKYADVVAVGRGTGSEFFIVWSEDTRDAGDVMGLRVDFALRRSRGPAFPIAQGPGTAEDPTIDRDPVDQDQFLVLFTDDRNGNRDIYGTRLVGSGLPRGGPTVGHFPVVRSTEDDYAPVLLVNLDRLKGQKTDARHLLVWTTDDVTDGPEIFAQRLEDNGYPLGRPYRVAGGPGIQAWPAGGLRRVDEDRPGAPKQPDEWLVAWVDDGLGTLDIHGVPVGIFGQVRSFVRVLASD